MSGGKKTVFITYTQNSPYASPWSYEQRLRMLIWQWTWGLLCSWTPKPLNRWRVMWLKIFGAKIYGKPFVHQRARIQIPWNLTMHDHACLGDGAVAYTLGEIEIMEDATVAQEAYLCTGDHDFDKRERPLKTGKIFIGKSAFIGARAFVLPGISIGAGSIVGACAVVTKNVLSGEYVVGNPAKRLIQSDKVEL